jgi:hypothetical protein
MGPQLSSNFKRWSFNLGALTSLIGAVAMLTFVVVTYIERDVLRMRGVVLSFVLMGLALIVNSEAHTYFPVHRDRR